MHFEDFIEAFPEDAYEDWLENDATPKQKDIALRIREADISEEEANEAINQAQRQNAVQRFISAFRGLFR